MSDEEKGGSSRADRAVGIASLFIPHPSLGFIRFWQGIVEIIARVIVLVLVLIMFIASSVAEDEAGNIKNVSRVSNAKAAAGWTIFIGVVAFVYEIVFILCRFLNFVFMTFYRQIVLIVDIIVSAIVAIGLFAGAVSMAVGAEYMRQFIGSNDGQFDDFIRTVTDALGAAAFFSFATMFGFIFLIVWMVLYLVFNWDVKNTHSTSSTEKE